MKIIARISFYIAIISLIIAVAARAFYLTPIGINPINFMNFANTWLFITIAILLFAIYEKVGKE
jgi:hypothetical protein